VPKREIYFKKQTLGKWRRSDGESTKHVNEEAMFREIGKLVNDGWHCQHFGVTFTRGYLLTK
jgi:hypothetical protein